MDENNDRRPDPKPRKHPYLWQAYLHWGELVKMRQRHMLRISSIKKGKSNLSLAFEEHVLEHMGINELINDAKKVMIQHGEGIGPVWDWLTAIKGLKAGGLAAQLLAQIDDIGKFDTVSKLWMFSGWGLRDGQVVRCKSGEKSPYNRRLKSIGYLIMDQFVRQQTPLYADIYYDEKRRQRQLHPEKIKGENGKWKFNDGHIDNRARRKTIKIFLQHLWVNWRESEGLAVTEPYIQAIMGHTNIITNPM